MVVRGPSCMNLKELAASKNFISSLSLRSTCISRLQTQVLALATFIPPSEVAQGVA